MKTSSRRRATTRTTSQQPAAATPAAALGSESPNLGACLRRLRFERRLSIADVSAATGIAKSTLSRVENDQLSLTYSKLLQLCHGLRIDLAELFTHDPAAATARPMARRASTPAGAGRHVAGSALDYEYLCTDLAGKKMTPMIGTIRARSFAETNGFIKHDGEEFSYVLQGRLELHSEFYEPLIVEQGDSVYFDSTMGHAYVSIGSEPLRILSVCTTPEPALVQTLESAQERGRQTRKRTPSR